MIGMGIYEAGIQKEVPNNQEVAGWKEQSETGKTKSENMETADSELLEQYLERCKEETEKVEETKKSPEDIFAEFGYSEKDFLEGVSVLELKEQLGINEGLLKEANELMKGTPANCYFFAFGYPPKDIKDWNHKPQPGELALSHGIDGHYNPKHFSDLLNAGKPEEIKSYIVGLCKEDCQSYGKEMIEVGKNYQPEKGERLVVLMSHKGKDFFNVSDYHFMVKGENGTYLHKPGLAPVTDVDNSGHLIRDPEHCDTMYESFLGYFVVRDKEV